MPRISMPAPLVGIIMGSDSDWPTLEAAAAVCTELGVPFEVRVLSAHRTPDDMARYARTAHRRGLRVIVAAPEGPPTCRGWLRATRRCP